MTTSVAAVRELYRFRELVANLVSRELKVRYKRSYLGMIWTMLNPLLQMSIYTIVFSSVMRFDMRGYPVFLLSGLLPWMFMHQSVSQSVPSLLGNAGLIRKIRLPKAVFPISVVASNLVNFGFSLAPLVLILLVTGTPITPAFAFLPLSILVLVMFTAGLSMLASSLTVFFRDIAHLIEVFFSLWFYLTPIIYREDVIPEQYRMLIHYNPARHFVAIFRGPIFEGSLPSLSSFTWALGLATGSLLLGWAVFHWNDRRYIHYL